MEYSIYKHSKLPTEKPRVKTEKLRVNKLHTATYIQQPAHTSTNPTNHADILKIKPIHNHRYPTRANEAMNLPQRYPTQSRTQSAIPKSALDHLMATEFYTDLHACSVLHPDTGISISYKDLIKFGGIQKNWSI